MFGTLQSKSNVTEVFFEHPNLKKAPPSSQDTIKWKLSTATNLLASRRPIDHNPPPLQIEAPGNPFETVSTGSFLPLRRYRQGLRSLLPLIQPNPFHRPARPILIRRINVILQFDTHGRQLYIQIL